MGSTLTKQVRARDRKPPSVPPNLTAVAISSSEIRLECGASIDSPQTPNAAVTGVAGYRWYSSPNGDTFALLDETAGRVKVHAGLAASTTWWYRVSAIDGAGNESAQSASVTATTEDAAATNRAPVWSSASLTINAYPGDVISRQLTYGSLANEAGMDCWDLDGDTLEFSEVATGVLSLLGLSISSTGLISGTIPADAEPQSLTFQVSASDGALSAVKSGTVTVYAVTDVDEDWRARSRGESVFWACNFAEWVRGIEGYTSQPVLGYPSGQPGRRVTDITTIAEVPQSESATLDANKYNGDLGDGGGIIAWREYPNLSGRLLMLRPRSLYAGAGGSSDWKVLPWAWVPEDYADAEEGTGNPNERRGIAGTQGEGNVLPFLEDRIDIDPATGLPYRSSDNPQNRPMVRHFYLQYRFWVPERWAYYRPNTWRTDYANGVGRSVRGTKQVFINGGASGGQVALGMAENFMLRAIYTDGSSFQGAGRLIATGTGTYDFTHSAISVAGAPTPTYGAGAEGYMAKYGPADIPMVYGEGMRVGGVQPTPDVNWWPPQDPRVGGVGNYVLGNSLSDTDRNYPYGGWPMDGGKPFPDMPNWSDEAASGIVRPNVLHTVEVLYSVQVSAPINKATKIASQRNPLGPCFVAVWAAPDGDPPVLLWHSGSGDSVYPALLPTQALHRASGTYVTTSADDSVSFESQDNSTAEDRANCGFMVVGAYDGFDEPTDTVFYALRANPSGDLEGAYAPKPGSKTVDPGSADNFGAYLTLGFARGALASLSGTDVSPYTRQKWQYIIEKTEPVRQITVPNAYQNGATNVTAWVHKYTMAEAMAAAPAARSASYVGDCFNQHFVYDSLRPLGNEVGYGEVIFSMKPIPFPQQIATPLPRPWMP